MIPLLLVAIVVNVATFIAQTSTSPDWIPFLNTGVTGAVVVALIRGWLVAGKSHDRTIIELDNARADLKALQERMLTDVVPAITRQTDALTRMAEQQLRHSEGKG